MIVAAALAVANRLGGIPPGSRADIAPQARKADRLHVLRGRGARLGGFGDVVLGEMENGRGLDLVAGTTKLRLHDRAGIEEIGRIERLEWRGTLRFVMVTLDQLGGRVMGSDFMDDVFHERPAVAGLPIPPVGQQAARAQGLREIAGVHHLEAVPHPVDALKKMEPAVAGGPVGGAQGVDRGAVDRVLALQIGLDYAVVTTAREVDGALAEGPGNLLRRPVAIDPNTVSKDMTGPFDLRLGPRHGLEQAHRPADPHLGKPALQGLLVAIAPFGLGTVRTTIQDGSRGQPVGRRVNRPARAVAEEERRPNDDPDEADGGADHGFGRRGHGRNSTRKRGPENRPPSRF